MRRINKRVLGFDFLEWLKLSHYLLDHACQPFLPAKKKKKTFELKKLNC